MENIYINKSVSKIDQYNQYSILWKKIIDQNSGYSDHGKKDINISDMEGYNHRQRGNFLCAALDWDILKSKLDGWFSRKI